MMVGGFLKDNMMHKGVILLLFCWVDFIYTLRDLYVVNYGFLNFAIK
jgi:hypothetical protein